MIFNKRILLVSILLIFLFITSKAYLNHVFFLDFADEEENFLPGKYIFNGKKLYSDIFVQHQPTAYIISGFIQKIVNPKTISALVKVHRFSIILWSALWGIALTLRFGLPLFIAVLILELAKISLLGNLFLAESLVVYPLIYIGAYTILIKKDKFIELFFVGLLIAFVFYSLSPLWPLIIFISLYLCLRSRKHLREALILIVNFLLITILVFQFSSIKEYFINTIYITLKYYLPLTKDFSGTFSPLKGLLAPILALFDTKNTHLIWVIKALSIALLFNLLLLLKKKRIGEVALIIVNLGLASIRYVKPSSELYGAFHMLPWFSLLIAYTTISSFQVIKLIKNIKLKIIVTVLIILVLSVTIVQSKYTLFDRRNPETDLHVHYSPHYNYGDALRIMKKPDDALFVVPVNSLVYWYSDISPISKYIFFYEWMEQTDLTQEIKQLFKINPPDFLYCVNCQKSVVYLYIDQYRQLKKNGQPIPLFVRKDRLKKLSTIQKDRLIDFNIQIN